MATGTVMTLISGKGFGFIVSGAENTSYLFHDSAVAAGNFGALKIGQRVSFDEEPDPCESGHRRAGNIRPIDGTGTA